MTIDPPTVDTLPSSVSLSCSAASLDETVSGNLSLQPLAVAETTTLHIFAQDTVIAIGD